MTIDKAISHAMEVAEGLEKKANTYGIKQAYIPKSREPVDCISCAADHRQLAEWLRELKQYRNDNKWISCKDQMPEDGISILICSERGTISKATYDSDMGYFYIADSELHYNQLDITHWQPLPQPPKEREQSAD